MNIEYEATFTNINKDEVRQKLAEIGAVLVKKEYLQKRVVFELPAGHEINGGWLRVRDEGDKITMSLKIVDGNQIHNQQEAQLIINDFEAGRQFLLGIGCQERAYQENTRELWKVGETEITIDEWPFLEPFVEVEGVSEEVVKDVAAQMGFDYAQAKFCSVDTLYHEKYNIDINRINRHTPKITFEMTNPFIN